MKQTLPQQLSELNAQGKDTHLAWVLQSLLVNGVQYRKMGRVQYTYRELQEQVQRWVPEIDKDRFEELLQQEPSL